MKTLINFDGQTLFKVGVSESFTVPAVVSSPSPTGRSSGVSPTTTFDALRPSVGGAIFAGFSDAAGTTQPDDIHIKLVPGDVIACSAVSATVANQVDVSLNGVLVAAIGGVTVVAGVLGHWA